MLCWHHLLQVHVHADDEQQQEDQAAADHDALQHFSQLHLTGAGAGTFCDSSDDEDSSDAVSSLISIVDSLEAAAGSFSAALQECDLNYPTCPASLAKSLKYTQQRFQKASQCLEAWHQQGADPQQLLADASLMRILTNGYVVLAPCLEPWKGPLGVEISRRKCVTEFEKLHKRAMPQLASAVLTFTDCVRRLHPGSKLLQPNLRVPTLVRGTMSGPSLDVIVSKYVLGKGGFGTVLQGWCPSRRQPVAVKELYCGQYEDQGYSSGETGSFDRIVRLSEIATFEAINKGGGHRNLLSLLGWRKRGEDYVLVMQFVGDCTPAERPFSKEDASEYARQVGDLEGWLGGVCGTWAAHAAVMLCSKCTCSVAAALTCAASTAQSANCVHAAPRGTNTTPDQLLTIHQTFP